MTLYHRTTKQAARRILREGFRDGRGTYGTSTVFTGVWLSDVPLDENEGAWGPVLLKVNVPMSESDLDYYEWVEEGKGYREWLVPSELLRRAHAEVSVVEDNSAVEEMWQRRHDERRNQNA